MSDDKTTNPCPICQGTGTRGQMQGESRMAVIDCEVCGGTGSLKTTAPTAKDAYQAACRVMDRDGALGMEAEGILDNVMAELAKIAGEP